jgi:hypothetical protein
MGHTHPTRPGPMCPGQHGSTLGRDFTLRREDHPGYCDGFAVGPGREVEDRPGTDSIRSLEWLRPQDGSHRSCGKRVRWLVQVAAWDPRRTRRWAHGLWCDARRWPNTWAARRAIRTSCLRRRRASRNRYKHDDDGSADRLHGRCTIGSYTSADPVTQSIRPPPTTRTRPSGSRVAV